MESLQATGRFLELALFAGTGYVAYAYSAGHDVEQVAVALFALGVLAVVLLAHRFREDYAPEADED